jgi:hypothetical protein
VIAMQANRITSSQTITTTVSQVQFNNTVQDTAGGYSLSTFNYTIPVTGIYTISGNLMFTSAVSLTSVLPYIYVNGSPVWNGQQIASATVNGNAPFTYDVQLSAGATVGIWAQTSGASSTLLSSASAYGGSYVNISRQSGPAVITATESVNARYTNTSGQSIPASTLTTVTGWTKDFDSHNFVSTSGVATIPVSGKYLITYELLYASAVVTSGTQRAGYIIQAGSVSRNVVPIGIFAQATVTTFAWIGGGPTIINCLAGDTLTFQTYQTEATARSLSTDGTINQICIARVGN